MKKQLKRLGLLYPGLHVSLTREGDIHSGRVEMRFCAYRGTNEPGGNGKLAYGKSAREAVNNLITADRSTSAGQEASSNN